MRLASISVRAACAERCFLRTRGSAAASTRVDWIMSARSWSGIVSSFMSSVWRRLSWTSSVAGWTKDRVLVPQFEIVIRNVVTGVEMKATSCVYDGSTCSFALDRRIDLDEAKALLEGAEESALFSGLSMLEGVFDDAIEERDEEEDEE